MTLNDLAAFINAIPIGAWTAIGGVLSLLTAIAVVSRTNSSNDLRQRTQLQHDAQQTARKLASEEQRQREKIEFDLRQSVFLDAAEAINAGQQVIIRLGDLNVPQEDVMKPFTDKVAAFSKVNLVGGQDVVEAIALAANCFGQAVCTLQVARIPVAIAKEAGNLATADLKRRQTEIETLQKQTKEELPADKLVQLNNRINYEERNYGERLQKWEADQRQTLNLQIALLKQCVDESAKLGPLINAAMVAIRKDLGLTTDADKFLTLAQKANQEQTRILSEFFDRMMATYGADSYKGNLESRDD